MTRGGADQRILYDRIGLGEVLGYQDEGVN